MEPDIIFTNLQVLTYSHIKYQNTSGSPETKQKKKASLPNHKSWTYKTNCNSVV
jgi:hypothetical protein